MNIKRLTVLTFTLILCAATTDALAAPNARTYELHTRLVEESPSVGEVDGSLQMHISADGTVSGYYRPDNNERFIPVTGGLTGDRLWLDIGTVAGRRMHVNGTFAGGAIDAHADRPIVDGGQYTTLRFIATPQQHRPPA